MLYRALENIANRHRDHVAIVGTHAAYTFGELLSQVRRVALYLQQQGLGTGDYLVVGIPPSPEFYALFFAAAALGITTIPTSASGKLSASVRALEPLVIAGSKDFISAVTASGIEVKHTILWHPRHGLAITPPAGVFVRKKLIRKEAVLGTSSSGTTGEPVIFMRGAGYLYRRALIGAAAWQITPGDTMLSTGPLTGELNTTYHLVLPIIQGSKIVVLEKFHRREVVEAIIRNQVTVLFAVPMLFDVLARLPDGYRTDFSSLKRCIAGGAHLPHEIHARFRKRFGLHIAQGYGGAHFTPAFTVNLDDVPGSVGKKNGLFPVEVVNTKGRPVSTGKIGEIVIDISKIKMTWAKAELERNSNRRGSFVYTGDLGRLDDGGNLFVVGRKVPMIKVGGKRVAPAEVEDALRSHPSIQDALVFPIRTGQTDEAVAAIVVSNRRVTVENLVGHCARLIDPYKCPRKISFRKSLPRNAHGKIIRYLHEQPTRQ
jgi:long-chain acyl-CoA synthetase